MTRKMKLTRALVDKIAATIPDPGPMPDVEALNTEAAIAARHADALAARPPGPFWVFAFGSLIWNPGVPVEARCAARAEGWHRAFCLGPDTRYRGNPDAPGIMLSLAPGGQCNGVALRLPEADIAAHLMTLITREPPVPPIWLDLTSDDGPIRALCFVAPTDEIVRTSGLSLPQIARQIAPAVGMFGNMPDYVLNTVEQLEAAGLHDEMLWELQALLADELAAL